MVIGLQNTVTKYYSSSEESNMNISTADTIPPSWLKQNKKQTCLAETCSQKK